VLFPTPATTYGDGGGSATDGRHMYTQRHSARERERECHSSSVFRGEQTDQFSSLAAVALPLQLHTHVSLAVIDSPPTAFFFFLLNIFHIFWSHVEISNVGVVRTFSTRRLLSLDLPSFSIPPRVGGYVICIKVQLYGRRNSSSLRSRGRFDYGIQRSRLTTNLSLLVD
jgi:hypothetical protein